MNKISVKTRVKHFLNILERTCYSERILQGGRGF